MKTSTKVLLGLGTTAFLGTTIAVMVSEKVAKTVKQTRNRQQVKQFITDKLESEEEWLRTVDELSDADIASVVALLGKAEASRKNIYVKGNPVRRATEEAKSMLAKLVETLA